MTNHSKEKSGANAPTGGKRLIVVDDEPGVLSALKLLLKALGHSVTDFAVPEEGLEAAMHDNECDLMLCDLKMPRMDGLQVLEQLMQHRQDLPFVLMSAHASNTEVERAIALGASGFLGKPFTPEQLKEVVAQYATSTSL